ncbi:MAG: adenylate kinase [Theionarchaea archaeon DG-70-1]|nr:MAG: adenylate kinase [Theionarchaea archaeon DG-70-1]
MRIVFLGPPGSGKGTQAQILAQKLGIPQISSGDLLREAVQNDTLTGKKAKSYMEKGELVPDSIVIELVQERIKDDKAYILDGFPRNVEQAEKLDNVLSELGLPLDYVVNIEVPLEKLIERLSGRLTCKECNAIYHSVYNPPKKEGICDVCGGELFQRSDDTEAAITQRFETYKKQTEPVITYYREKGMLTTIDGTRSIEETAKDIEKRIT